MKKIFIAACGLVVLASCDPVREKCYQCTVTQRTSQGITPGTVTYHDVCEPSQSRVKFISDNTYSYTESYWVGPAPSDSVHIQISSEASCGGVTYSD